jgi:hypothetical protein
MPDTDGILGANIFGEDGTSTLGTSGKVGISGT